MKIKGETIPGLKVSEYFLVIKLTPAIEERAEEIRTQLYASCEVTLKLAGRPVMGLAHFAQYEQVEERMLKVFQTLTSKFSAFKIHLNSIGSIPFHTIFIDAEKSGSLNSLVSAINKEGKKFFQLNKDTTAMIMRKPHITLTRKLDQKQYDQCLKTSASIIIDESFTATTIIFLKRTPGTRQWQDVQQFELKGESAENTQGQLF